MLSDELVVRLDVFGMILGLMRVVLGCHEAFKLSANLETCVSRIVLVGCILNLSTVVGVLPLIMSLAFPSKKCCLAFCRLAGVSALVGAFLLDVVSLFLVHVFTLCVDESLLLGCVNGSLGLSVLLLAVFGCVFCTHSQLTWPKTVIPEPDFV